MQKMATRAAMERLKEILVLINMTPKLVENNLWFLHIYKNRIVYKELIVPLAFLDLQSQFVFDWG